MSCVQCRVRLAACVLCKVKSETVGRHVCVCVQCRVRLAACVLCAVTSETVERRVCCVQCRVRL